MQNQMVQQVMMGLLQVLSQLMGGQSGRNALADALSGGGGESGGGGGASGGNALSGGGGASGGGQAGGLSGQNFAPAGNSAALGPLPPANTSDQATIKDFIRRAAGAYGADPNVLTEIARRESNFQAGAVNDWDINAKRGTPSKGMFQFIEPTFNSFAPKARAANPEAWEGLGDLNWMDWRQQALVTAWAIKNGLGSHWATYKAAGGT